MTDWAWFSNHSCFFQDLKEDFETEEKVDEVKSKSEKVNKDVENLLVQRLERKIEKQKKKQHYEKKYKDSCGLQ